MNKNPEWLDMSPRQQGYACAFNFRKTLEDNPHGKAPHGALQHTQQNHPHHEWRNGFLDARIATHRQIRQCIGIGRGMPLLYRTGKDRTREALLKMGSAQGELLCLTILCAMMDAHGMDFDDGDVEMGLQIYGAMKDRLAKKEAEPLLMAHGEIYLQVHKMSDGLAALFKKTGPHSMGLNVAALDSLLESLEKLDAMTMARIATGQA